MMKDIEKVEEILSSKEKFLENIRGVECKIVMTAINSQFIKTERYSATNTRNITSNINTILIVINMMIFSKLSKRRVLIIV